MSKVATRSNKEGTGNWTLGCGKNYELMELTVFRKVEQAYNVKVICLILSAKSLTSSFCVF